MMTPEQLTTLATEINTDPNAYGIAPLKAAGNDQGIADLLNLRRAAITIREESIESKAIWEAIDVADYAALGGSPTAAQLSAERRYLSWLSGLSNIDRVRLLNDDNSDTPVITNLKAMFGIATGTRTRLLALAQRQGSRAEQLFGRNVMVSAYDVAASLGRG